MNDIPKDLTCDRSNRFTCDWIFNILVVLSDGKVVCGCADPYGERPLGNLNDTSLLDIWRSERVRRIRMDLNDGHACFCDSCGLKRPLEASEPIPRRPVQQEILPRIFLEPTVACNLSCYQAVCNRESGIMQTRSRAFFPLDEFKKVINEVGPHLVRLDLFNYGDPFVHPEAVDMVEYVKKRYPHIYVYTSTNGLKLNSGKIRRLVQSSLDEITFSVDGPDDSTYSRYRQGGDFHKVLDIMSEFVSRRNQSGRVTPFINWRYILFRWNDSRKHMNRARRLAKAIGVDRLTWEITDHPPSASSLRYQTGTTHWRRIYPEIWDSSQLGNAIRSKRYRARIRLPRRDLVMKSGSNLTVAVKVVNRGGMVWPNHTDSGRRTIRLGAQLFDSQRRLVELNYARAFLNRTMTKGDVDTVSMDLPAVDEKGDYWLKFDMVSEGIDWFEKAGSPVAWKKLTIR